MARDSSASPCFFAMSSRGDRFALVHPRTPAITPTATSLAVMAPMLVPSRPNATLSGPGWGRRMRWRRRVWRGRWGGGGGGGGGGRGGGGGGGGGGGRGGGGGGRG